MKLIMRGIHSDSTALYGTGVEGHYGIAKIYLSLPSQELWDYIITVQRCIERDGPVAALDDRPRLVAQQNTARST
jgi:hypothetical protein